MGRKKVAVISLAALCVGFLVSAWAAPGFGPDMSGGLVLGRLMDRLDLTPEQRATVEDIVESYRPRLRALREAHRESRSDLVATTPDDPNYASVVAEASQAAASHAGELVNLSAGLRAEVHAVLTEEQRARALELREEFRQRREEGRGRWRQRCQPESADFDQAGRFNPLI